MSSCRHPADPTVRRVSALLGKHHISKFGTLSRPMGDARAQAAWWPVLSRAGRLLATAAPTPLASGPCCRQVDRGIIGSMILAHLGARAEPRPASVRSRGTTSTTAAERCDDRGTGAHAGAARRSCPGDARRWTLGRDRRQPADAAARRDLQACAHPRRQAHSALIFTMPRPANETYSVGSDGVEIQSR